MNSQHPDIEKVLLDKDEIASIVARMGEEITHD